MKWTEYDRSNPPPVGKYLVKTKTMMGNTHRIEATLSFSGKNPSWSCTNQIVTEYLDERNEDMDREEVIKMLQKKLRECDGIVEYDRYYDGRLDGRVSLLEELIMELQSKTTGI